MIGLSIERPIPDHHPKAHIHEIRRISWNPADFTMKSGGFHPWNLADFTHEIQWISPVKSGGFHEIREIWGISWNPWNLVDFTLKSSRFHEIQQISWNPWNLVDFTHEIQWISPVKSTQNYKSKCFSKNSSVWWMQGGGFHPWNPPDFTWKSGRFHLWNPPKIIKASVSTKTLQFDECRVGDFTLKPGGFQPWNLVDFTQISPVKSTQNYKSKCFSKNSWVWWMQGGGFHPRNLVDFTLKSGGFQPWNLVDFTQISPVKSTQNYKSKCFSKNSWVWWMQGGEFHPWNPPDFTLGGYDQGFHEIHPEIWWISPRFHLWNPPKL